MSEEQDFEADVTPQAKAEPRPKPASRQPAPRREPIESFELDPDEYEQDGYRQPAPKPKPKVEEPPAAPKYSERLVKLAEGFGMSPVEIGEHAGDADLQRTINHMAATLQRFSRENSAATDTRRQPAEPPAPPPPAPVDEFEEAFPATEYEPKFRDGLKKLLSAKDQKIAELEEKFQKQEQARAAQDFEQTAQQYFAANEAIYGKGPNSKIAFNSPEGIKRQTLYDHLTRLINAKAMTTFEDDAEPITAIFRGQGPAAPPDLAERPYPSKDAATAGRKDAPSAPQPPHQKPRNPETGRFTEPPVSQEDWDQAALAKPSQQRTELPVGPKRAKHKLHAKLEHANLNGVPEEDDFKED